MHKSFWTFFSVFFVMLVACAHKAPTPKTEIEKYPNQEVYHNSVSENFSKDNPTNANEKELKNAEDKETVKTEKIVENVKKIENIQSSKDTNDLVNHEIFQEVKNLDSLESADSTLVIDPYKEFPALADKVFAYADSLYKKDLTDSASAYLERFRVIKPLWVLWESKTDSLLNVYGKSRAEKAKKYESLILQIQNVNRVQGSFNLVKQMADSLISLNPGDSIVQWANNEKSTAFENTLKKARLELLNIKNLAEDEGQFVEAENKLVEFQMRYKDFEDSLQTEVLLSRIIELSFVSDSLAKDYWVKNDPGNSLLKADSLIEQKNFLQAKEILNKLMLSSLRKQAKEKYTQISETFCNQQRKSASQLFSKSQKQKELEKKNELLNQALESLEKCLVEFPDNSQKQKILDNQMFLKKELKND